VQIVLDGNLVDCKECKTYNESGQITNHIYHIQSDINIGEYKTWYDNGQLREHKHFNINGKLTGESREWYPNGDSLAVMTHVNGKLHGRFRMWNNDRDMCYYWYSSDMYRGQVRGLIMDSNGFRLYMSDFDGCYYRFSLRRVMSLLYFKAGLLKRVKRKIRESYLDDHLINDLGNIVMTYYFKEDLSV
jgi:antitoxin component YwqK of YwqJK toxin-antitoxin module